VAAGAVWVPVLPSLAGWNDALRAQLSGSSLGSMGKAQGLDFGRAMAQGAKVGMTGLGASVKAEADAAASAVTTASAKVKAARDLEAKAAGQARVAELALQETQAKGIDGSAKLAAAEERLATAQRAQAAAADKTSAAETALSAASDRAAASAKLAATTTGAAGDSALLTGTKVTKLGTAAESSGGKISQAMLGAGKSIAGLGELAAGVAVGAFLVKGVEGAMAFQKQLTLLSTAGGEAKSELGAVGSGMETIAVQTGTSLSQLSDGMYTLEKAGIRGASGLNVLRVAAEGAKAENVDLGTMTNALTSIMRSYNIPAGDATQVTNELVTASGRAKTTMQDFAGSLSTVLPIASAAHISFAEVGGAIATLTQHGTSADEATQELAGTIRALQAPNAVASKAMAQLGIASNDVATGLGQRGLQGTITMLSQAILSKMGPAGTVLLSTFNASKTAAADAQTEFNSLPKSVQALATQFLQGSITLKDWNTDVKGLAPAQANLAKQWATSQNAASGFQQALKSGTPQAVTYTAELKSMMGGAQGLNTALQLTGGSAGLLTANTNAVAASSLIAGKNIATWSATSATFSVRMDQLKESVSVAATRLGTALLPSLTMVAGGLLAVVNGITSFVRIADGLGGGTALEFFLGYLATMKAIRIAQSAWMTVTEVLPRLMLSLATGTNLAKDGFIGLDAAMDANPAGLVAAGITALVLVGKHFYDQWHQNKEAVDSYTTAIEADNGALGVNTRQAAANALGQAGVLKAAQQLGIPLSEVTNAVLGQKSAITDLTTRHQAFATAALNSASAVGEYGAAGTVEQASNAKSATAWQILSSAVQGNTAQVKDAIQKAKDAAAAQDLVTQAAAKSPAPLTAAAQSAQFFAAQAQLAAANTAILTTDTNAVTTAQKNMTQGLTALENSLSTLTTNYFSVNAAQDTFEQDVNALVTAHKAAKGAINGTSDASITYRQSIETLVGAVGNQLSAEVSQHVSATKVLADYEAKRKALVAELTQMGLNKQEIGYYVGALGKIPSMVKTDYTTPGSKLAQAQADLTRQKLLEIPTEVGITITIAQSAAEVYKQLQAFAKLGVVATGAQSRNEQAHGLATGGPVRGVGGPTQDNIPIWASAGEYMVNAASYAKHAPLVHAINSDTLPKYATGGMIGSNWNTTVALDPAYAKAAAAQKAAAASSESFGGGTGVTRWAPLISTVLGQLGLSPSLLGRVETQMQTESTGNPTIVNKWDSNWLAGHPSVGLMQVIQGTFDAYAGPYRNTGPFEYGVSTNPQANIYAGLNYARSRYGDGLGYLGEGHGYARGGLVAGMGTATSDSIAAQLSAGEFVVNAQATKKHLATLQQINAGIGSNGTSAGISEGNYTPARGVVGGDPAHTQLSPITAVKSAAAQVAAAAAAVVNPTKAIFATLTAYVKGSVASGVSGDAASVKSTITTLSSDVTKAFATIAKDQTSASATVTTYTAKLRVAQDQMKALSPVTATYTAQHARLTSEVSAEQARITGLTKSMDDLSKKSTSYASEHARMSSEIKADTSTLGGYQKQLAALSPTNANYAADHAKLTAQITADAAKIGTAQGQLAGLDAVPAGTQSKLVALISTDNTKLQALATQRTAIATQLSAAQATLTADQQASASYASSLTSSLTGASTLSDWGAAGTPAAAASTSATGVAGTIWSGSGAMPVVAGSGSAADSSTTAATPTLSNFIAGGSLTLAGLTAFGTALSQLRTMGYSSDLVDQIAQAGVTAGMPMAQALLTASKAQVTQIDATQAGILSAATTIGSTQANAMYGAAISNDQQTVNALTATSASLTKQTTTLATTLQNTINSTLASATALASYTATGVAIGSAITAGIESSTKSADSITAGISTSVASIAKATGKVGTPPVKVAAPKAAKTVSTTINVTPKTASFGVADIKALQALADAANRTGRPS
jgi:hypothetical protein